MKRDHLGHVWKDVRRVTALAASGTAAVTAAVTTAVTAAVTTAVTVSLTVATTAVLARPVPALHAQQMHQAADFDPSRAILGDEPMFDPYYPEDLQALRDVLGDGLVDEGTPVLVVQRGERTLALLTLQMAYHHVAQGTLDGEPWMVAF